MNVSASAVLLSLLLPSVALAFDTRTGSADRIAILVDHSAGRRQTGLSRVIAEELAKTLRAQKIDCRILPGSIDELQEGGVRDDLYIELSDLSADSTSFGGVSSGGTIGSVGVGGEVSIVGSHAEATLRVYDGETLELLEQFEVEGRSGGPTLTGIGIGDRHGVVFIRIPILGRRHERAAVKQLGRDAASQLLATLRVPAE